MSYRVSAAALIGALLLGAPVAFAQTAQPGVAPPAAPAAPATRSRTPAAPSTAAPAKKAPTPGQSAARERQKQCGAEWKEAKAAGKVAAGMKWPQYWSQCNARLKQTKA